MAKNIDLNELTIAKVHQAYSNGDYTCKDLVQAYLTRINAIDKNGPALGSILALSITALQEADALDKHYQATKEHTGPLHGIPVLLKDQAETAGLVTTYGSIVAKDNVPSTDATVVRKLKAAGAIILAKTSMPDFACGFVSTSSIPPHLTKNPYALERDPGGSSAGTGAAIAANLGLIGLGEDTGGSIRVPSSFCGLVGLRPTPGLISRKGLSPLLVPQDTPGPMCRTVTDAALMLDTMVGYDEGDPYTATAVLTKRPQGGSYAGSLRVDTIKQARLGVLRKQGFGEDSDPEYAVVNKVINAALATLQKAGTQLLDIEIPDLAATLAYTSTYFSRSRHDLDTFLAEKKHLSPHTTIAAIHAAGLHHGTLDLIDNIATSPSHPHLDPEYHARMDARDAFQKALIGLFATHALDALVFPDVRVAAPTHEDLLAQRWSCLDFPVNTILASHAWMPAVSVPAGMGMTEGVDGEAEAEEALPVGLELVGLPYQEQKLLQLAYGVEALVEGRKAPTGL